MTDEERLGEIRARAEAATEGSWTVQEYYGAFRDREVRAGAMGYDPLIAKELLPADAAFIAAAREDVPWLLDQLSATKGKLKDAAGNADIFQTCYEDEVEHAQKLEAVIAAVRNHCVEELAAPSGVDPYEVASDRGIDGTCTQILAIVEAAPAEVLDRVKADAWDEGVRQCAAGGSLRNPYRKGD